MVFSGLDGFKLSCFSISIANDALLGTKLEVFVNFVRQKD